MPPVRTRNLFISHSWTYGDAYEKLCAMLDAASNFEYRNYSVPKDDPVHDANNRQELYDAIKAQIARCQVVVIMAGKYASFSKWIQLEIQIAKKDFEKPVIGVCPWAAEQTSTVVQEAADEVVRWNTESIVSAIRNVC